MRKRNSFITIFLAFTCPGLGHLYVGAVQRGLICALAVIVAVLAGNTVIQTIVFSYTIVDAWYIAKHGKPILA